MIDVLRKYVDSLAGITELPRDRAEKLVTELAKRGEVRARDIQRTASDLMRRSTRNRQELVRLVRKEIRTQVHSLGLATRDDVDRLARRVRALEGSKKATRSPKTTARKKAATGKKAPARKKTTGRS